MAELCGECGHPLLNAAGAGLYCTNCGEPVGGPRPADPEAADWSVERRLTKRAELVADLAVQTMAERIEASVEIGGRKFTIVVTNGDTLDTATKEYTGP